MRWASILLRWSKDIDESKEQSLSTLGAFRRAPHNHLPNELPNRIFFYQSSRSSLYVSSSPGLKIPGIVLIEETVPTTPKLGLFFSVGPTASVYGMDRRGIDSMRPLNWLANFLFDNVLWEMIVMIVPVRIAIKWLLQKTFDWKQEIAFWVLMPAFVFTLLVAFGRGLGVYGKFESLDLTENIQPHPPISGTFAIVFASIHNVGSPTSIENWHLAAVMADGSQTDATLAVLPPSMDFNMSNATFSIPNTDALYDKTMTPIPSGAIIRGVLFFVFENVHRATIEEPGTLFRLSFEDVTGRSRSADFVWTGLNNGQMGYIPGLHIEFKPNPTTPSR